jgi:hypothetical protein
MQKAIKFAVSRQLICRDGILVSRLCGSVLLMLVAVGMSDPSSAVELQPQHPYRYRVVEGDTLWGIAGRFLRRPWEWPLIWHENRRITNPDTLYPGDVILLEEAGGQPYLRLETGSDQLEPRVRVTPLENPIPVIPTEVIRPFLSHPRVVSMDALERLPYVVDLAEEHVMGGPGNRALVRAIPTAKPLDYVIFRAGDHYQDAETGESLGQEALFVAEAVLEQPGDPATLRLTRAEKEVRSGDHVMPARSEEIGSGYLLQPAKHGMKGHIIGVMDGVSQIGQFSIVALDRGQVNGVVAGQVFDIWQQGSTLRDSVKPGFGHSLTAPEQHAGLLMVFLPYERVSFALVMKAEQFIHVQDIIRAPQP